MSQLRDPGGTLLTVAAHHKRWCHLFATTDRLALLAPRDHGKTTVSLAYVLWRFYQHALTTQSGARSAHSHATFSALIFSATRDQAEVLIATFRDLLTANEWLLGPIERPSGAARGLRKVAWSRSHIRLASGAQLWIRAFRTSTRGLHPQLLLLDDVLSDQNSMSQRQRDLSWRYFAGTLLPMNPTQIVVVGTAFHQDDLLHRLAPRSDVMVATGPGLEPRDPVLGFAWHRFRALDEATDTALWPDRHPVQELRALRDFEPTIFSREYQNEPRDDAASIFPYELTQRALDAGSGLTFVPGYVPRSGEFVVLGADLAISEAAGADFTVVIVAAFEIATGRRRILTACRVKGLDLTAQVDLIEGLCARYHAQLAIIEQNGFQRWLIDELRKRPLGARIIGHTTGQQKTSPEDGVLILKLELLNDRWVMPTGDQESRQFARTWQAELSAFGWRNGKLEGLGEHDDCVIASWFVELAIRFIAHSIGRGDEIVTMEDEFPGWEPVRIGPDY